MSGSAKSEFQDIHCTGQVLAEARFDTHFCKCRMSMRDNWQTPFVSRGSGSHCSASTATVATAAWALSSPDDSSSWQEWRLAASNTGAYPIHPVYPIHPYTCKVLWLLLLSVLQTSCWQDTVEGGTIRVYKPHENANLKYPISFL